MRVLKRVTGDVRLIRNKDLKVEGKGEERKKNAHKRATHYKTQNDEKKKTQRMQQEIACWWMLLEESQQR